jgi:hypothetical protein
MEWIWKRLVCIMRKSDWGVILQRLYRFRIYEISAVTDGGNSITWPSQGKETVDFTLPKSLPNGDYLREPCSVALFIGDLTVLLLFTVRVENIALHQASNVGGAQFYIS